MVAPTKRVAVKNNTNKWFNGKIPEKTDRWSRLCKIFKSLILYINQNI